jgi:uncharacterized membrane protein YfcA
MSIALIAILCTTMLATSFLSGIFGMAGGMILIGVLLALLPLPAAMVLHAITQMASNGWRAVLWRRHVVWAPVFANLAGAVVALAIWSLWRYVPSKALTLILLGLTPFMVRLLPPRFAPNPENPWHGVVNGVACMTLMLLAGVSGPLFDTFFLGGRLDRRQIVATKAASQIISHAIKLVYFGGVIEQAAALDPLLAGLAVTMSITGTSLAKRFLEKMSDAQYRLWAGRIITAIAGWFIVQGGWLLVTARM